MDLYSEDYEDRRGLDGVRTKKVSAVYIVSVNVFDINPIPWTLVGFSSLFLFLSLLMVLITQNKPVANIPVKIMSL
jgi:hypothetical protein